MVSFQNPRRRKNIFDSIVPRGLSIFNYYGEEFSADRIVRPGTEEVQKSIAPQTEVTWFFDRRFSAQGEETIFSRIST
jgi:hypothetical protein